MYEALYLMPPLVVETVLVVVSGIQSLANVSKPWLMMTIQYGECV